MFLQPQEEGIEVRFGEIHTKGNPRSNGGVVGGAEKQEYVKLEDFVGPPWALRGLVIPLAWRWERREECKHTLGSAFSLLLPLAGRML